MPSHLYIRLIQFVFFFVQNGANKIVVLFFQKGMVNNTMFKSSNVASDGQFRILITDKLVLGSGNEVAQMYVWTSDVRTGRRLILPHFHVSAKISLGDERQNALEGVCRGHIFPGGVERYISYEALLSSANVHLLHSFLQFYFI